MLYIEVDRAVDNLVKSGKMFNAPRRDSMPMMGGAGPRGFAVESHGMSPQRAGGETFFVPPPPTADVRPADNRMVNPMQPVRHYSVSDFDAIRSPSAANLQNFYATQRFQSRQQPLAQQQQQQVQQQQQQQQQQQAAQQLAAQQAAQQAQQQAQQQQAQQQAQQAQQQQAQQQQSQVGEAETAMQAKRRAAAQRERELRNYHQEQQYNRSVSSNVPPPISRDPAYRGPLAVLAEINTFGKDRVMSPGAMNEEDRRDLIARQHRALYSAHSEGGHSEDGNNHHHDDGSSRNININSNGASAPASNAGGTRGPSPMPAFDPFGLQQPGQNSNIDTTPVHTPAADNPTNGAQSAGAVSPNHTRTNSGSPSLPAGFSLSDNARAGLQGFSRTSASSPGGSPPRSQRPPGVSSVAPIGTRPAQNQALNNAKRSTTPLASPLSYGFGASESDPFNNLPKERSASAASTEQHTSSNGQSSDGLGWSKVWGPGNKGLNNVASVWG